MTEVRIEKSLLADPGFAVGGYSATVPAGTRLTDGLRAFDLRCAMGGAGTANWKIWLVHRAEELGGLVKNSDGSIARDGYLFELLASGTFTRGGSIAGVDGSTLVSGDLIADGVTLTLPTALDLHIDSHYGKGVEMYNPGAGGISAVRCRDFGNSHGIIASCWLASVGAKALLNLST